jgi:hypothetical protein
LHKERAVISVIVPTFNDAARLNAVLAPLVPPAMEGVVRELIIVDAGSTDGTLELADDAGARIVTSDAEGQARFDEGARVAKGPWLLLLEPSVRLEFGWEAAVLKHVHAHKGPARFRLEKGDAGLLGKLTPPKATALLCLKGGVGGGLDRGRSGFGAGAAQAGVGQAHRLKDRLLDARGWV